jgi:hypothetical protein
MKVWSERLIGLEGAIGKKGKISNGREIRGKGDKPGSVQRLQTRVLVGRQYNAGDKACNQKNLNTDR